MATWLSFTSIQLIIKCDPSGVGYQATLHTHFAYAIAK